MTKLPVEALEYNVSKADQVLQIKNFGTVIPSSGNVGGKYNAVRACFSTGGGFPLEGLDDIFANQGYVFARFFSVQLKYKAETYIKKARIDGRCLFVTNGSNVSVFTSHIR